MIIINKIVRNLIMSNIQTSKKIRVYNYKYMRFESNDIIDNKENVMDFFRCGSLRE